ncbi:hypothetical protein POPTR_003G046750v4 [Populus trichocarpa]|nr:hypothetical protein POPTR_003G046750v4 [Populus trichocarpa]
MLVFSHMFSWTVNMRNTHVLMKENKLESILGRRDRLLCSISSSVRLVVFKGNYKLHCSCSSVLVPSNLLFAFMLNMFLIVLPPLVASVLVQIC